MKTQSSISKAILRDLENLYQLALEKENFSSALKAKELLGREYGLFAPKSPTSQKEKMDLNNISDEDINQLIKALETKLKMKPSKTFKTKSSS